MDKPALWDGRPFPGPCDVEGCPYQAVWSIGRWTGGGPGLGEWERKGRCAEHTDSD
jgi:hypothetical protein